MMRAILTGKLDQVRMIKDPVFGFDVPERCEGIPTEVLNPKRTWKDPSDYDSKARELTDKFNKIIERFSSDLPVKIRRAGP